MKWFDTFVSDTLGGTGNQLFFRPGDGRVRTGRIYYKVFHGGDHHYSLLFSNTIDSTYKAEYSSYANLVCDMWEIVGAGIGICKAASPDKAGEVEKLIPLKFSGAAGKTVAPGEFFASDPVEIAPEPGDCLCVEISFRGAMIPYHLESILPTFVSENGRWIPDKRVPAPGMIGCDRSVAARIGYFGDSITQGIGTPPHAYTHWCALVADALGARYSHWNLGIGYGRGQDAATGGAWFYKARHVDAAVVTFGSNDVGRGRTLDEMKRDFAHLIDLLKSDGVAVFLQTLPPFDWQGEFLERWNALNAYISSELAPRADGFLDVAPLLTAGAPEMGRCKYGKHPDEAGCRVWAEALIPRMREFLQRIVPAEGAEK